MAKQKTAYVCSECGADHPNWQGQCGECKEWNTLKAFIVSPAADSSARNVSFIDKTGGFSGSLSEVQSLSDINLESVSRILSGMSEFDRVLGGRTAWKL